MANDKDFDIFPFWGRLKIDKKRTTLVIDETKVVHKKTKKEVAGYVHREATHSSKKDFEEIFPNPDTNDKKPMYLKRPRKLPKSMIEKHNKNLTMPAYLKNRYSKNNKQ